MIRLLNAGFRFGRPDGDEILHDIDLTIEDGEWVAVTGRNGSGKSLLLKIMAGLLRPDSGSVLVDGADPMDPGAARRGNSVGIVFQNPDSQFVTSTVEREILFGLENIGAGDAEREETKREAVSRFGLEALIGRNPHMLSGGEKQRLLLACVWAMRPQHIMLDEPCSFLDAEGRGRAIEMAKHAFREEHRTVVWATLDAGELEEADRVIFLDSGHIAFDGAPHEALRAIPEGVLIGGEAEGRGDGERGIAGGRANHDHHDRAGAREYERVALLEEAVLSHGTDVFRLDVPLLGIDRGDVLGIVGPSGAGKSTLLLGCAGLLPLERGMLELFGSNVASRKDFPAGRISFLFQSPEEGFFAPTVGEEVELGHRRFGDGMPAAARDALARVGLEPDRFMDRSPFHLSQGEKRLVALASQLVLPAELFFFDEPALFLDGRARASLSHVIDDLTRSGMTLAIASHDRPFVEPVATRFITLSDGSILL